MSMDEITEGSKWNWTSEFHLIVTDVPVTVKNVTDSGAIMVEVDDKELVSSDVARAKETYSDNGNDMSNVTEVHPFVKSEGGEIVEDDTRLFHSTDRFREYCTRR